MNRASDWSVDPRIGEDGRMTWTEDTILITGGTSGIGRALARELHSRGNTVIICGRRTDRLDAIRADHPGIVTRACDVASAADREELARWIVAEHPDLNVLINNAGIQLPVDATTPVDLTRTRSELEINLVAPFHLGSLLAGHLAGRARATIVNVTSGLAFAPMAGLPIYCASKAALHSLTLSLRAQYRGLGIRVVELAPPAVDTELGAERRSDPTASHGGLPVAEFVAAAMAGLEKGQDEVLVGFAAQSRAHPDQVYARLNGPS
jgi:uncharacterized oxidoreductase